MERDPLSHKGDNGRVAVIGGSFAMHGAPLFSALAAEASGADLIHVAVPAVHATVARLTSLNFQVKPFAGDELTEIDIQPLQELLAALDCAVIGPGINRSPKTLKVLQTLIAEASCALVLDASALQPWTLDAVRGKSVILTPHLGELERMGLSPDDVTNAAIGHGVTIHVKGAVDQIAGDDGSLTEVDGGNAGLTVGGTGDVLAGLIAGLWSQGFTPKEACRTASLVIKSAAENLRTQKGFAYTAQDVIALIPEFLTRVS